MEKLDIEDRGITLPPEIENMLLEFTIRVLIDKPEDITSYAADYFTQLRDERQTAGRQPPNDESSTVTIRERLGSRSVRRSSVMCEPYDPEKDDDDSPIEVFPKDSEERQRIKELMKGVFIFRVLGDQDKEQVIDAMEHKIVSKGQEIISEGDTGDFFYMVDHGQFGAFVSNVDEAVTNYEDSGSFGELALLHNQPRQATVRAVTDGAVWAVSRSTFKRLVIKRAFEKRQKYLSLLSNVPEIQPLSEYERMQVADALVPVKLEKGQILFKEGDEGDGMYFVEEGRLSVTGIRKNQQAEEINQVGPGQYVGELALLKNEKRAATVTATEVSQLAFLDREAFERLLGPCLDILKRKGDTYHESEDK